MMKFLESEFSSYVYVTNSGVVLSASPIPPQFLICATVNRTAKDWVEAYHKSWENVPLVHDQEDSLVLRTREDVRGLLDLYEAERQKNQWSPTTLKLQR
eukprot:8721477-Prorocentrum_lima.AAC.1